jgi:xanthine dehydrogenase accessory factor
MRKNAYPLAPVVWEALVTAVYGSAPTKIGAQLLLHADGHISGNLGGGHLEHAARQALLSTQSAPPWWEQRFVLGGDTDQCCGGVVDVVLVEVSSELAPLYVPGASRWYQRRDGRLRLVGGEHSEGKLGLPQPMDSTCRSPTWLMAGEIFLIPATLRQTLWVLGAGHVGRAIAARATCLDFSVTVFDGRREWLEPGAFPSGVELCPDWELARLPIPDEDAVVLILTYSHALDFAFLRHFSSLPLAYLGVIASKSKAALFRHAAQREGWALSPALRMPMGLPGMGKSPAEIAVSVLAELLQLRQQRVQKKENTDVIFEDLA